jgi:hypothetical protein
MLSSVKNTVTINKSTLINVLTYLQDSQDKIKFLQLESQLQQDEIQQTNQHFELVFVQNNSLFEFENDSYQHPSCDQINDATSEVDSNEDDVCHKKVTLSLSKPIIIPSEEIINNKRRICLGYKMEVTSHIPNYSKPI